MFRTARGLNRPAHMQSLQLPEYPIPKDLEVVLDINDESPLSRKSLMFSKILESISSTKYVDLSENNYIQLLKLSLFLEEYQSNEEMKRRKMFNQKIKKLPIIDEALFAIHVKELDEERVWIREGDFVQVTDTITYQTYMLRVAKVTQTDIIASDDSSRLANVYVPTNLYNITFGFQNYPLKCAHYALWITYKENVITYLFPHKSKPFVNMENDTYEQLKIFNPNIETNPEQKQAVLKILNKSSYPAPYVLYGPPGTGKTATLIEAITQIHKASPSNRILVCTPSNTAADEVAKRLLKYVDPCYIYRIYSQSRDKSSIDKELRDCSFYGKGKKEKNVPLKRENLAGKAILISTLCTAMRFTLMKLNNDYFSHIIIDEAGQGTEADILIPIAAASKDGKIYSQIVLAGDPQQLGPTVISKLADHILGRSVLERMMSYDTYQKDYNGRYNPKYITKLLHNYRSHPSIIHVSNKLFYDNELVPKYANTNHIGIFPVIFHGVEGVEEKYTYSPSTYNYEEIKAVLTWVYDLIDNRTMFGDVKAEDIGIVTPFKLQSKRIKRILHKKDLEERRRLHYELESSQTDDSTDDEKSVVESENPKKDKKFRTEEDKVKLRQQNGKDVKPPDGNKMKYRHLKDINVGTVELFQGQERKIMIMTSVRSKTFICNGIEHIGFLSNPKRFNVALTRAQDALIVVGNPGILQKHPMWRYLLEYCLVNDSYMGLNFELRACNEESTELQSIISSAKLFKGETLKLFLLDGLDSAEDDLAKTIDLFVEKDDTKVTTKDELQELFQKMFVKIDLKDK